MSLKFGIYLVEQRVITPEQFCGLVKIQQEALTSMATIALRKNVLTIKQVSQILDLQEANPQKSFCEIATEADMMERIDAERLLQVQQASSPSIKRLVTECGLLTQRQAAVLFRHFERMASMPQTPTPQTAPAASPKQQPSRPGRPKFKQRPVIVHPYAQTAN